MSMSLSPVFTETGYIYILFGGGGDCSKRFFTKKLDLKKLSLWKGRGLD